MVKTQKHIEAMNSVCSVLGALLFLVSLPTSLRAQAVPQYVTDMESQLLAQQRAADEANAEDEGVGGRARWFMTLPTDDLLQLGERDIAVIQEELRKSENLLDSSNFSPDEVNRLTNDDSTAAKSMLDAVTIYGILQDRTLTPAQEATITSKKLEMQELEEKLTLQRGQLTLQIQKTQDDNEIAVSNAAIDEVHTLLEEASRGYATAATVFSNAELDQAETKAREALAILLKAGRILTNKDKESVVIANASVSNALNELEDLRIKLQYKLADI